MNLLKSLVCYVQSPCCDSSTKDYMLSASELSYATQQAFCTVVCAT